MFTLVVTANRLVSSIQGAFCRTRPLLMHICGQEAGQGEGPSLSDQGSCI